MSSLGAILVIGSREECQAKSLIRQVAGSVVGHTQSELRFRIEGGEGVRVGITITGKRLKLSTARAGSWLKLRIDSTSPARARVKC